jgi:hypothetical protein
VKRQRPENRQLLDDYESLLGKAWDVMDGRDCDSRDTRAMALVAISFLNAGSSKARLLFGQSVQEAWRRRDPKEVARQFLQVIGYVFGEHEIDVSLRLHDARADGARRSAEKRVRNPTQYMKRLAEFEDTVVRTKLSRNSPLELRSRAAQWLHCRLSYVNTLLKCRDERRHNQY